MFGNVRGGNYGRVGQALAREQQVLHGINMAASPDYGKIAKESIKGRSRERKAVTEAEAKIHRIGLDAAAYKEIKEIDAKADKDVEAIKKPARRFAGVVGAAGTLAGAWMLKKDMDATKELNEKRDAATAEFRRRTLEIYSNSNPEKPKPLPKPPVLQKPELIPIPKGGTGTGDAPGGNTPTAGPTSTGGWSDYQVKQAAMSVGFSPESARIISAISGSESGRDPTNDTIKSGLYKRNGEDSVGLMQINWGYHSKNGWLQKMGITKREQLYDPITNLKAAKYLYDGRGGGFDDWTDWGNGRYKNYLDR